ncbi:MAG: response regulator transcription factor [candidate division SR1 bacterium]|nr:response regulator transcription factor [candidate division SR1 bacterium]
MKTSILLVEDNQTIGQNIQKYLELEGYSVLWVQNGSYANEVVKHQEFDLVLLDLMLPGTDGLVVAKTIKQHQQQTRILMMTAKGQLEDKLEGFEVGADDYLVKPFDLEELVARIEALLRRSVQKDVVSYGVLTLDNLQKKIFKGGEEIKLSLKEFQILELLIRNKGMALSRLDIIEEIRGGDAGFEEDGKLDVYLSTIRRKIGKEMIETIKGYGYRLISDKNSSE